MKADKFDYLYDITLLTDNRYLEPKPGDIYFENIFLEDELVRNALEKRGMKVHRTNWDNPDFDWSCTRFAMFRTTWDYFDRIEEFKDWLDATSEKTEFINPIETILWNLDKHYLLDLKRQGTPIPPTIFIERGDKGSLSDIARVTKWEEFILKPAIGGGARYTYHLRKDQLIEHELIFNSLIGREAMLLQEFQESILSEGEVTFMVMNGRFTHAVLKKAKPGDFRVQDDFGGTVHPYSASPEEILFAERVVSCCDPIPVYARVDVLRDGAGKWCVGELELIEPELWFRESPEAAEVLAEGVVAISQELS